MYKVILVDDEPIIVEGLKKMIPWSKYQCEVVDTAGNAKEGIEKVSKWNPDILFTDIRMGSMDGLTMIAALKSEHPNMEIAILTGYRDFEYAQRAINLGVTRFLLKPSKMNKLIEAVTFMKEELDTKYEKVEESDLYTIHDVDNYVVRKALDYMENHYKEPLHLKDVADVVYVSSCHLSKLINRELESSFSDVLNDIRIRHAKELLEDPSLRIVDVAYDVGFSDLSHFSRTFKKMVGVSPNQYRKKEIS